MRQYRTDRLGRRRLRDRETVATSVTSRTTRFTRGERIATFFKLAIDVHSPSDRKGAVVEKLARRIAHRTCEAFFTPSSLSRFAPASFSRLVGHIAGDFDRAVGCGFVPGFRDRRAALVADAAIVGRETRLDDEQLRATCWSTGCASGIISTV